MLQSNGDAQKLFNLLNQTGGWEDFKSEQKQKFKLGFGYPGNKWGQLEKIIPHFPRGKVFVDVFGGSGTVSFNVNVYPLHVYNDKCSGVTAFFRSISNPVTLSKLSERIEMMIYSKDEFIWCRDTWDHQNDLVERAARWFYMVHCSYACKGNEWARVRKPSGERHGRFGKIAQNVSHLHEKVSEWQIENDDWWEIFKRYDSSETVFYCDPTYYDCTPGMYRHELSKLEHINLLDQIHNTQGFVAVSGYGNDLYDHCYDWTERHEWEHDKKTFSGISCEENNFQGFAPGDIRLPSTEVLWIKDFK